MWENKKIIKSARASKTHRYRCSECGIEKDFNKKPKSCNHSVGYNLDSIWANIIRSALGIKSGRKRLDIDISKQYIERLYFEQGKKCAISGVNITLGNDASLDRIDSALGYIKENVQWVHKDINIMKGTYSEEYFIEVCKNVCSFKDNR